MEQTSAYLHEGALFHGHIPRVMGTRLDLVIPRSGPGPADPSGAPGGRTGELGGKAGTPGDSLPALWDACCVELDSLSRMLDRFRPDSEVSRVNAAGAGTPVPVSPALEAILLACRDFHRRTDGLFDITRKDFSKVILEKKGFVTFASPGITLDFGGIGKGWALAAIRRRLAAAGIGQAFVDFGGSSILACGAHPYGTCWPVTVRDPGSGRPLHSFPLKDRALSISGNQPGYTGHIVHPGTGQANRKRMLCAAVCTDPVDAEVLSTALMIASPDQRERLQAAFPDAELTLYPL